MSLPLITIGITCYNAAETITDAVNSALSQEWENYEIIIVDDCSTDTTFEILESIKKKGHSLQLFRQEKNQGVAAARNRVLKEANGEFIAFFDDDDTSLPHRLGQQYSRLTEYENSFAKGNAVLCHTARTQHYPNGDKTIAPTAGCTEGRVAPHGQDILERLLIGQPCSEGYGSMATCSQMARKCVYENLRGFDETLRRSEDTDFTIRHAHTGGHFVGIASPLVIQTMTMTSDKSLDQELLCTLQYLKKHRKLFASSKAYDFQCCWTKAKYDYFRGKKRSLIRCFITYPVRSIVKLLWAFPSFFSNQKFKAFYCTPSE